MPHVLPTPSDFDDADRQHLAEVLRDPIIQRALAATVAGAAPLPPLRVAGLPTSAQAAIGATCVAYREFVRDLERLASPPAAPGTLDQTLSAWNHLSDEEGQPTQ